jgi:2,3-dihydroxy-p-cumate/2,3-dihydroxybenzoate 3,4-dioxygenase
MSVQRARFARRAPDPKTVIGAIVADGSDFFFGKGFFIEMALAFGDADGELRKIVRKSSRRSRFFVEKTWTEALEERGLPRDMAGDILALTLGMIRGFVMRRFIDDDPARREHLVGVWADMVKAYLSSRLSADQLERVYSWAPAVGAEEGTSQAAPIVRLRRTGARPRKNISIAQLCYVRLGSSKLEESARFASEIIGLERVGGSDGEAAFRSDGMYHRICLTEGAPEQQSIGLELSDEADFDAAKQALAAADFPAREADPDECKRRHVRRALITRDGSGNEIDLVVRPARSGRRYFPSRDAGIRGFQGLGLRSNSLDQDLRFWTEVLDARVSDRVGDITYLQIDERHHRVVLYPSKRKGILDIALDVESFDCVMQNSYFMKERQIKVLQGPGRETTSGQSFLRFQGPDNMMFSYVHGMEHVEGRRPRQFNLRDDSLCSWGSHCADVPELRTSTI